MFPTSCSNKSALLLGSSGSGSIISPTFDSFIQPRTVQLLIPKIPTACPFDQSAQRQGPTASQKRKRGRAPPSSKEWASDAFQPPWLYGCGLVLMSQLHCLHFQPQRWSGCSCRNPLVTLTDSDSAPTRRDTASGYPNGRDAPSWLRAGIQGASDQDWRALSHSTSHFATVGNPSRNHECETKRNVT